MKPFLSIPYTYKPFLRLSLPRHTAFPMMSTPCSEKVIVILGPTGSGKTRLSLDLALNLGNVEILNSDKIQMYRGLNITTNKITEKERKNAPHHHLGSVDPFSGEFSASDFRFSASQTISQITSRRNLPIIAGGSNSYIYSLLSDQYEPGLNVFTKPERISTVLRYNCCFLWVDVKMEVLREYLEQRVDEMLDLGMLEELSEYYKYRPEWSDGGLSKAIGVPEFQKYLEKYPPGREGEWDQVRTGAYEEAVRVVKENTCELAKRQVKKIGVLKEKGWDIHRLDATSAFMELLKRRRKKKKKKKKKKKEIWKEEVVNPSMKIVRDFLEEPS